MKESSGVAKNQEGLRKWPLLYSAMSAKDAGLAQGLLTNQPWLFAIGHACVGKGLIVAISARRRIMSCWCAVSACLRASVATASIRASSCLSEGWRFGLMAFNRSGGIHTFWTGWAGGGVYRGGPRVVRGGSWNNQPSRLRSATRNSNNPRNSNLGFRLASPPTKSRSRCVHGCSGCRGWVSMSPFPGLAGKGAPK